MNLQEKSFEFVQDTTKQIITLSTAVLALTITFAEKLERETLHVLLGISWLSYILAIVFGIWALLAMTGSLEPKNRPDNYEPSVGGVNVRLPAGLQILAFVFATAFIVVYVVAAGPAQKSDPNEGLVKKLESFNKTLDSHFKENQKLSASILTEQQINRQERNTLLRELRADVNALRSIFGKHIDQLAEHAQERTKLEAGQLRQASTSSSADTVSITIAAMLEIAFASDYDQTTEARIVFWSLQSGKLPLIKDEGISKAAIRFGNVLKEVEAKPDLFNSRKAELVTAAREFARNGRMYLEIK